MFSILKVHVYCLVRELPNGSTEQRLLKNLEQYGMISADDKEPTAQQRNLKEMFRKRVTAVKGGFSSSFYKGKEEYGYLSTFVSCFVCF